MSACMRAYVDGVAYIYTRTYVAFLLVQLADKEPTERGWAARLGQFMRMLTWS
jgi:hypothetical protein